MDLDKQATGSNRLVPAEQWCPASIQVSPPVTLSGIWADLRAYTPWRHNRSVLANVARILMMALLSSGFHMVLVYRIGAFCYKLKLLPLSLLIEKVIFHWYHCIIPCSVQIGSGLWVAHPFGIILNKHARLGCNVCLRQNVEIVHIGPVGSNTGGVVGDRARLHSGAILLRGAVVGEDAVVAARAVVTQPVPPRHLAMGMPARFKSIIESGSVTVD